MKRRALIWQALLILGLSLWLGGQAQAASAFEPSGYLITFRGHRLEVQRFTNLLPAFVFFYEGVVQTVPMRDVKSLTVSYKGLTLELRDGKTLLTQGDIAVSTTNRIDFVYVDPVTNQATRSGIEQLLVTQLVFN